MANLKEISRKQAAACLDAVAQFIARVEAGEFEKETPGDIANRLRTVLADAKHGGIQIPRECYGEVHKTGADNCGVCMDYTWGLIGERVKVK